MRTGWNALFKVLQQTEEMEINVLMGQLATCLQHRQRRFERTMFEGFNVSDARRFADWVKCSVHTCDGLCCNPERGRPRWVR